MEKVIIDFARHASHSVAKVVLPKITGKRIVHLSVDGPESWCIRDYIRGQMLKSGDSSKTADEIEAEVTASFKPEVKRAVGRVEAWAEELAKESRTQFGKQCDLDSEPNADWGRWRPLR